MREKTSNKAHGIASDNSCLRCDVRFLSPLLIQSFIYPLKSRESADLMDYKRSINVLINVDMAINEQDGYDSQADSRSLPLFVLTKTQMDTHINTHTHARHLTTRLLILKRQCSPFPPTHPII